MPETKQTQSERTESNLAEPSEKKDEQHDPRVDQALGIFGDLTKLEVTPATQVGAREILSTIAVRRPKSNEFIRVDPARSLTSIIYEDRDQGEVYFIKPDIRPMMIAGTATKLLVLTVNQIGAPFIWPVPCIEDATRRNLWNESARAGYHRAEHEWAKLVGDRGAGQYRIYVAEGELPPPRFPDKPFSELLAIAFGNRLIDNEDHHIIKAMRGLTV